MNLPAALAYVDHTIADLTRDLARLDALRDGLQGRLVRAERQRERLRNVVERRKLSDRSHGAAGWPGEEGKEGNHVGHP